MAVCHVQGMVAVVLVDLADRVGQYRTAGLATFSDLLRWCGVRCPELAPDLAVVSGQAQISLKGL